MSRDQRGNKKLTLTITSGDNVGSPQTHTNHNVGRFPPEITSTIMWGDFHLRTTRPPLLFRWKSSGVSIPGVWLIFAENLKVINAGKCPHRWHWQLAREPRFVLFWWWTGLTALSALKVHVLKKILWPFTTRAQQGASLFWLIQSSRNFN